MNTLKKLIVKIVTAGVIACAALTAHAQVGYDMYAVPRTCQLTPLTFNSAGITNGSITNFDRTAFDGIAKIDFFSLTNDGKGAVSVIVRTSSDLTNFVLVPYTTATLTTVIKTNALFPVAIYGTNYELLPGTVTTPVAATAGFASPYLLPGPMTNTNPLSLPSGAITEIGFQIGDCNRYIQLEWTSATNSNFAAVLTGRKTQ